MQIGPEVLSALLAAPVIGLVLLASYRVRALSISGAAGAFIVGLIVFVVGGISASIALFTFFVFGSLLSKLPRNDQSTKPIGHSERNWKQVAANGGVPCGALLLMVARPDLREETSMLFLGSIATMFADTSATEIGTRYGKHAINILTFKPIKAGTSGGVSFIGSLASIAAPALIAVLHLLSRPLGELCEFQGARWVMPIVAGGFLGTVGDSILGASVQAKYRGGECDKLVESRKHCNDDATLVHGFEWIGNNAVNAMASLIGAIVSLALLLNFG
jgi:uncharacterized protein (TIGR00297 family)